MCSCCAACKPRANGCGGGYPTEAFNWYINTGVVTGGSYGGLFKFIEPFIGSVIVLLS
jgi:hypothetical protein